MNPRKNSSNSGDQSSKPGSAGKAKRRSTSGALKPVQRVDLVQEVVERLREEIIGGHFAPNDSLPPEGQLALDLGVSRTVVREAMCMLVAQGLVEVSQGRPPRVRPADPQTVVNSLQMLLQRGEHSLLDLMEVRRPLETEIAATAACRATPAQIDALKEALDQLTKAQSLAEQVDADTAFHERLAEATGNPVFQMLLATVATFLYKSRKQTIARSGPEPVAAGHRAILNAIQHQNPDAARAAMLGHLQMAEADLRLNGDESVSN